MREERAGDGRVLFSYDVEDGPRPPSSQSDDVRDYNNDRGWGIQSWAQCDPAEFPPDVSEALGIGVWEDASGARVAVTKIRSFQGAQHCGWQDITFLELGPKAEAEQYVRDVTGELADSLVDHVRRDRRPGAQRNGHRAAPGSPAAVARRGEGGGVPRES